MSGRPQSCTLQCLCWCSNPMLWESEFPRGFCDRSDRPTVLYGFAGSNPMLWESEFPRLGRGPKGRQEWLLVAIPCYGSRNFHLEGVMVWEIVRVPRKVAIPCYGSRNFHGLTPGEVEEVALGVAIPCYGSRNFHSGLRYPLRRNAFRPLKKVTFLIETLSQSHFDQSPVIYSPQRQCI